MKMDNMWNLGTMLLVVLTAFSANADGGMNLKFKIDPLSAYGMLSYDVPDSAPLRVIVKGEYKIAPNGGWRPMSICKYRSKTARAMLELKPETNWIAEELSSGRLTELLAAGKTRTLIWRTFPDLTPGFSGKISLRLTLSSSDGKVLSQDETMTDVDLKNLIVLNDFTKLRPASAISKVDNGAPGWVIRKVGKESETILDSVEGDKIISPVVFREKLSGYYAIYVSVPGTPPSVISVRLSSDLYSQRFDGCEKREYFWKTAKMDNEHIIIEQPAWATGAHPNDSFRARLRYIKLVRLSKETYDNFNKRKNYKRDKLVYGYFEPYSWAFHEKVDGTEQFLQPVAAYRDAKVDFIDMQVDRLGARPIYPSSIESPLIGKTFGDATPGRKSPVSKTVSRLALYTNPTRGLMCASRAMNIGCGVNFGSGINYGGSPLEGNFSKKHPEYLGERFFLQYKFPEVRKHFLAMYEENLKMGIKRISLDFGRYSRVVDKPEYATLFLKELRALADKYSKSGDKVEVMVRFPVKGVRYERGNFHPQEWCEGKLIDTLVVSGLFPNFQVFDPERYIAMAHKNGIRCLVDVDGGNGHFPWPAPVLKRVKEIYDWGADGVYIYQSDARIVGSMNSQLQAEDKSCIACLGSTKAVDEILAEEKERDKQYSSGIYVFYPLLWQSYRMQVWLEGMNPEIVELYLDGVLVNRYTDNRQLYLVGKEGWKNNYELSGKPVTLKIRVKVGGKWIEKVYKIDTIHKSYS